MLQSSKQERYQNGTQQRLVGLPASNAGQSEDGERPRARLLDAGVPNIMSLFSDVQFYDYTKLPNRKNLPANYHLTFSLADGNDTMARVALANGMNVAAVFRSKDTVARYMESGIDIGGTCVPVSRGDDTDLRFLDAPRHCIGPYAKGNAKRDSTGFVRD